MPTSFKFKGVEMFEADLRRVDIGKRKDLLAAAALEAVEPLRVRIEELAPVDTGRLARSIIKAEDRKLSDIGTVTVQVGPSSRSFYGLFLEYGTAFMPAKPFVAPAIEQSRDKVESELVRVLNEVLRKV